MGDLERKRFGIVKFKRGMWANFFGVELLSIAQLFGGDAYRSVCHVLWRWTRRVTSSASFASRSPHLEVLRLYESVAQSLTV